MSMFSSFSSEKNVYHTDFEFVKNESTDELLVFKWEPIIKGQFPNGLKMRMKAILPYFDDSTYYFDMTPGKNGITNSSVCLISCVDKRRDVRVGIVTYDFDSTLSFSKGLVSSMCTLFHIRVHEVQLDRTEQNEQYLIGQSIMTSDESYTSFVTSVSKDKISFALSCQLITMNLLTCDDDVS
jgi:hypothetical protein